MLFDNTFKSDVVLPEYVPKGIEAASYIFQRALKTKKFLVYYDPDIDGLMSGLIAERFLTSLGISSSYFLNQNRAHGFKLEGNLEELYGYTIIAVDFSIPAEIFYKLLERGINVINIDHHEIDLSEYGVSGDYLYSYNGDALGVILNNQYVSEDPKFRFLSGAGMVYYFVDYMCKVLNKPLDRNFAMMTGITLLSDVRDIGSPEARAFLKCTFTCKSSYKDFLVYLVSKEKSLSGPTSAFGKPIMGRNFTDFTFSPVINALLRANKGADALALLRGDEPKVRELKYEDKLHTYRNIQKEIIGRIGREYKEGGSAVNYGVLSVCVLENFSMYDCNITNYIGVACSKVKGDKNGVILVMEDNKIIRGSFRGSIQGVDYLSIFKKHGIEAAGHSIAFGILKCDLDTIDFQALNDDIQKEEVKYISVTESTNQVVQLGNLKTVIDGEFGKKLCVFNEYRANNERVYVEYVGPDECVKEDSRGKFVTIFDIDGINIKSYDKSLNLKNSYILFGFSNSEYREGILQPRFECRNKKNAMELNWR